MPNRLVSEIPAGPPAAGLGLQCGEKRGKGRSMTCDVVAG